MDARQNGGRYRVGKAHVAASQPDKPPLATQPAEEALPMGAPRCRVAKRSPWWGVCARATLLGNSCSCRQTLSLGCNAGGVWLAGVAGNAG